MTIIHNLSLLPTFHGIIFSLITGIPFLAMCSPSVNDRITPYAKYFDRSRLILIDEFDCLRTTTSLQH